MKPTLIFLLFFTYNFAFCQINLEIQDEQTSNWALKERQKLNYANKYFNNQEYLFARPIYDSLYKKHKSNVYIGYLLGSCSVYDPRFQTNAESLIKAADAIKTKLPDYDYFLGKAYLVNDKYVDAINQFEKYKLNNLDKETKAQVDHQLLICNRAIS